MEIPYSEPQSQQRGREIGMLNSSACLHPSAPHCHAKALLEMELLGRASATRSALAIPSASLPAQRSPGAGPGVLRAAGAQPEPGPARPGPQPAGDRQDRRVPERGKGSAPPPWGAVLTPCPTSAPARAQGAPRVGTLALRLKQALGNKICCNNRKSM